MKKIIVMSLFIFGISHLATANSNKKYDANATFLLTTVFNSCPIKFIQAMKGADRVGKAELSTYFEDEIGTTTKEYVIVTVAGGFAPSFKPYDVSTLKITKKSVVNNSGAADRPTKWNTTCQLISHK